MFEKVLYGNTKTILALLGNSGMLTNAYLAGGTAIALQLGHRISKDLDFFTSEEFENDALIKQLRQINKFELDEKKRGAIIGAFEEVKFSIFVYQYPVLLPFKLFLKINVLDAREVAAMKLEAIASRGKKRDFIDLYFVVQKLANLETIFSLYNKKYGKSANKMFHILKSLVYFQDAEPDEMPFMLIKTDWQIVKKFFEKEVRAITKKLVG